MSSSSNKKLRNRSNKSQHSASNLWNVLSENQTEVNTGSALDQKKSTPTQSPPQTLRDTLNGILQKSGDGNTSKNKSNDKSIHKVTVVIGQAFTEGWSYWCGDESIGIQLKINPEIDDPKFQAGTIVTFRKLKYRGEAFDNKIHFLSHCRSTIHWCSLVDSWLYLMMGGCTHTPIETPLSCSVKQDVVANL